MVRLAPSASNRQPWRVVRRGHSWDFFLSRARGRGSTRTSRAFRVDDIHRVDIGIAMSHFELGARAEGLAGGWSAGTPTVGGPAMDHVATWEEG
jgi:nitroreductase